METTIDDNKPRVMIVGAGLGGVTLALLLERANVPYALFERASEVKPLGSAISLGVGVIPMLKQIGLYDEFMANSKAHLVTRRFNENREQYGTLDWRMMEEFGGYYNRIIPRPVLYDMLLRQIPQHKIFLSKRVLSMTQDDEKVIIQTSDNQRHEGDILVGADGAYSGVRQNLYKQLKEQKKLPTADDGALPFTCTCLVGQTRPLDPKEFPEILEEECSFRSLFGDARPFTHHLNKISAKDNDAFRNSEWGPEAAEQMCKEVRDFPVPGGNGQLVLGDLIDRTPKEYISKVMLEEKLFDTWYGGRTVLLGDACHKMNPSGAMGAVNAMHDAIALANWINVLPSTSPKDINMIFSEYKAERYPLAKKAFETSRMLSKLIEKTMVGAIARFASKNMPVWLHRIAIAKMAANRPQVAFLPLVEDKGSVKPIPQPSLIKTRKLAGNASTTTTTTTTTTATTTTAASTARSETK
ncbi:hypothetical protein CPB97_008697 [Podila verticillata]|nr:hypothetical protein CPB97_008697 [Podila verticillata]